MAPKGGSMAGSPTEQPIVSRPLSANEALWYRAVPLGTGIGVTGLKLQGSIPLLAIQAAANALAVAHPVVAAKIVPPSKSKSKDSPELHVYGANGPQVTVARKAIGQAATAAADATGSAAVGGGGVTFDVTLHAMLEQELNTGFLDDEVDGAANGSSEKGTMQTSPMDVFQVHVYYSEDQAATYVMLRQHHACFDRASAATLLHAFLDALRQQLVMQTPDSATWLLPVTLPPPLTDIVPADVKPKGLLRGVIDGVGYVASASGTQLLPFCDPQRTDWKKNHFRSELVAVTLSQAETDALLAATYAKGCTLFGVEAAAVLTATAMAKKLGRKSESFNITCLVNCREHVSPPLDAAAVGLLDSGFPLKHTVSQKQEQDTTAFWELAADLSKAATTAISKKLYFTEMPVLDKLFSVAMSNPSMTAQGSFRTALLTAFADAPMTARQWQLEEQQGQANGVQQQQQQQPLVLQRVLGPVASCHGVGPCIGLPDFLHASGELELLVSYASPLFSRTFMRDSVAVAIHDILLAAAEAEE